MAPVFGWNSGCAAPSEQCGKRDLLFGRTLDALGDDGFARPPALAVPYGRLLTEPIEGIGDTNVDPVLLGGTRHLSAAQFARDQQDAIALVASQDGRFTVFAWSACEEMVHAHCGGLGMGVLFDEQIPAKYTAILESWLEAAAKQPA